VKKPKQKWKQKQQQQITSKTIIKLARSWATNARKTAAGMKQAMDGPKKTELPTRTTAEAIAKVLKRVVELTLRKGDIHLHGLSTVVFHLVVASLKLPIHLNRPLKAASNLTMAQADTEAIQLADTVEK
jgi:hypothetical protein